MSKVCNHCDKEYPDTTEYFHKKGDRLDHRCKNCKRIYNQKYNKENKEKRSIQNREYRKEHKDEINQRIYKWRDGLKEKIGVAYQVIHAYIKRRLKKPKECPICNEEKELQLASIDHTYTRSIEDWFYVCVGCHSTFDICRGVK